MMVKTENLYSFSQAAEILGVNIQRIFELTASPYVKKVHKENRIYFSKESIRKLVLRGDMISVEQTSRILNYFNISFTEQAVLSFIQRGILEKAPRIDSRYHSRFSKYNYSVNKDSLIRFLLEHGATEKEINDNLSALAI